LLILFVQSRQSLGTVANSEVVATEILSALVGSIGIVASVPVTTWLATQVVGDGGPRSARRRRTAPANVADDMESEFWDGPGGEYPAAPRSPAPRVGDPD
jgi:YibE/F-like protein